MLSSRAVDRVCGYRLETTAKLIAVGHLESGRIGWRAQDLTNLKGAAPDRPTGSGSRLLQLFDPLPECHLDVRPVVDGERVHLRERTARDVHVVRDERLDPGLVREQEAVRP